MGSSLVVTDVRGLELAERMLDLVKQRVIQAIKEGRCTVRMEMENHTMEVDTPDPSFLEVLLVGWTFSVDVTNDFSERTGMPDPLAGRREMSDANG